MRLKRELGYLCIAVILSFELYSFPITLSLSPPHSVRLEQRPDTPKQLSNGRSSSFQSFVFHDPFRLLGEVLSQTKISRSMFSANIATRYSNVDVSV